MEHTVIANADKADRKLLFEYRVLIWDITALVDQLDAGEIDRDDYARQRAPMDTQYEAFQVKLGMANFDRADRKWLNDAFVQEYRDRQRRVKGNACH